MVADLDAERLAGLESELGPAVAVHRCDVTTEADVESLAAVTKSRFGCIHVVFANAGIGSVGPIREVDAKDWMRVIEVNLLGPVLTIKHCSAEMAEGGSIVITASLNAVQPAAGMSAYCLSLIHI